MPTVIAQISDPHIKRPGELTYGVVDTAEALSRAVAALNALVPQPDLVVVSGDLVDAGLTEEYDHFRALMGPLRARSCVLPGNHDDREAMRRAFPDHAYMPASGPLDAAIPVGDLDVILLDSSVPGRPHGHLEPATLAWLDAALATSADRPALIFLHHPPFTTGIRHMDVQALLNASDLAEVVGRHARVRLVSAGHVHRVAVTLFAGVPCLIAPGTSHAVALDLDPAGPPAFRLETPGLYVHAWDLEAGARRLVSHQVPIGAFAGPYPFFDAEGRLL